MPRLRRFPRHLSSRATRGWARLLRTGPPAAFLAYALGIVVAWALARQLAPAAELPIALASVAAAEYFLYARWR